MRLSLPVCALALVALLLVGTAAAAPTQAQRERDQRSALDFTDEPAFLEVQAHAESEAHAELAEARAEEAEADAWEAMHAFYGVRPAAPDTTKYPPLPSWAAALTPKSTKTKTSTNTKAATATRVKSRESGIAKVKLLRNTTPKAARRAVLKTANTVRAVARSQPKVASRIGTVAKSLAKTVRTVAKSQAQVTNRVLPRLQQLRARVQAETLAQAYPTAVVTNAAVARSQIRGPDLNSPILQYYTLEPQNAQGNAVGVGRVRSAVFTVFSRARGNLAANVEHYVDALFNPNPPQPTNPVTGQPVRPLTFFTKGEAGSIIGSAWHTGHIIASTLGGSDSDPLNFFPQHYQSNSNGGRWYRAELIAGSVRDAFDAPAQKLQVVAQAAQLQQQGGQLNANQQRLVQQAQQILQQTTQQQLQQQAAAVQACLVFIIPSLDYNGGHNEWTPSGGTYQIITDSTCFATLQNLPRDAYANAFATHALGTVLPGMHILATPWVNGPDMALAAAPPGGVQPGYVVQANLF